MKPLQNIRVLDLSRVLAGPWASQTMADLGASVIKIEQPVKGDDTRSWGPPYLKDEQGNLSNESAYFLSANRGKKSVCVDLKSDDGQDHIRRLASQADVLIENFKVGQLESYGLDYTSLSKENPKLIYCSITGFGQTGPKASLPGYDFMIQGMSGLMSVTGEEGREPQKVGVAVTDVMTGLYSTIAILSALHERRSTDQGKHIDMALFDVAVAGMANQASNYLVGGLVPGPLGNAHPNIVPYQSFKASDGHFILAVGNDEQFTRLCELIGHPEMSNDIRFQKNSDRVENKRELSRILSGVFVAKEKQYWLDQFRLHNVPCGPINSMDEVFKDEQLLSRDMIRKVPHSNNREMLSLLNPITFVGEEKLQPSAPPSLGQHTEQVMNSNNPWDD